MNRPDGQPGRGTREAEPGGGTHSTAVTSGPFRPRVPYAATALVPFALFAPLHHRAQPRGRHHS